jgi:hypothetical protein
VVAQSDGTFYGQAMTSGDIYTVAGNGVAGCGGNGRAATKAQLGFPQDVTINSAGDLLIGQVGCHEIRMVTGGPSQPGTPGHSGAPSAAPQQRPRPGIMPG